MSAAAENERSRLRAHRAESDGGTAVTVVVVSYNARDSLRTCLNALGGAESVIVVDNASTDGSVEVVREFAGVRLIALDENLGFGSAANIGLRSSRSTYVLLLNCDAWPLGDAITGLVEAAEKEPRAALFGPRLVDATGRTQRSVIRHPGPLALLSWMLLPRVISSAYGAWRRDARADEVRAVNPPEFLQGAVLLIRRCPVEKLGGFDERFFMFNEDVDLCFRLRQAGWGVLFVPSETFVHVGGVSTAASPDDMTREHHRSLMALTAKHGSLHRADLVRRLLVFVLSVRSLRRGREDDRRTARWLASGTAAELTAQTR
jgi:N-acetylglucosaminyl-diphospho-decaprenol L-rhamnosyltransferase